MNVLLGVVVDSDVWATDTEVGIGTPLTSPFIEGIWGAVGVELFEHPPAQILRRATPSSGWRSD
jgi:hypothetical protein